jgi:hypothetical protein
MGAATASAPGLKADALVDELREEARWAEASGFLNLARLLRRAADRFEMTGK